MDRREAEAQIVAMVKAGDYRGAANLIVNTGRSSLDLKILISEALELAAGK